MRFQCLDVTCGKQFGWTAKKIVQVDEKTTIEYVVCPYCGSMDFDEIPFSINKPKPKPSTKSLPIANMESKASQFDPADLIDHESWKNRKQGEKNYTQGSLAWGWDFSGNFKPETVSELERQGTILLDQYEFKLNGKLVQCRKAKT